MNFIKSKNGSAEGTKKAKVASTPRVVSALKFKSVYASDDVINSNFYFNGCFKQLDLANNGLAFGINEAGNPAIVVLPDTNDACQSFKKTNKGTDKSKFCKIDNFAKLLGEKGLLSNEVSFNKGQSCSQFLEIKKVENDLDATAAGALATYEVIGTDIAPLIAEVKEMSEVTKAAILAARGKKATS